MTPQRWGRGGGETQGIKIDSQRNHFLLAITVKHHKYLLSNFPDNSQNPSNDKGTAV